MKNDPRSYDRNFYNWVKKPEKNSGLQLLITFLFIKKNYCSSRWLRTAQNNFILCVSIYYYFSRSGYLVAHVSET